MDPVSTTAAPASSAPLLRTLAPALRELHRALRLWLDGRHRQTLKVIQRSQLEGLATDLARQADALDTERPTLVIMLMGGTGVGKSTLLNALAGGAVAEASFHRPTTRDAVVYHHQSIDPARLDPALQRCRMVAHHREPLLQKILVDTPDLDSNDTTNRDKLIAVLPVADIVLYVGSQEKYHDRLGWDLFKQQRQRRAFAFVLNKWDRCLHNVGTTGIRPDQDLLKDLASEGFSNPLLFRTCAQPWLDARSEGREKPDNLPEEEQFSELLHWLEMGLSRLEIEAVKARGVGQLLEQLKQSIEAVMPPDLTEPAARARGVWERFLREEGSDQAQILANTLEPYQTDIEIHFSVEGHRRFRGLMAGYLKLFTKAKHAGRTLRDRLPMLPRSENAIDAPAVWSAREFAHACIKAAGEQALDRRGQALANRLLLEADKEGFPLDLLTPDVKAAGRRDWQLEYEQVLIQSLAEVEQTWTKPTGPRSWLQSALIGLANLLPEVVFLGGFIMLLWRYFVVEGYKTELFDVMLPFVITLIVLVFFQFLINTVLPVRWPAIRGVLQSHLERGLGQSLTSAYLGLPAAVADDVANERKQARQLINEAGEVAAFLTEREHAARIAALYGK